MEGLTECAERVFRNQVRIGQPLELSGLTDYVQSPPYATAVGLLHYGKDSQSFDENAQEPKRSVTGLFSRISGWFKKEF